MTTRELILLSPYRWPTQSALYLGDDDVATFLHGYRALWHPAAVQGAIGPPRWASPYDHEQPRPGFLYAVPTTPPLFLPDDWEDRVRAAGAIAFQATPDAAATLDNLKNALRGQADTSGSSETLLQLDDGIGALFHGVGLGFACVESLFEAMSHDNLLDPVAFWTEVQAAVAALLGSDPAQARCMLQQAADRLMAAREVLYPVAMHVVDLWLPDDQWAAARWPAAVDEGLPLNVVACAALLERLPSELLARLREKVGADLVEVCGGPYLEREDALLSLESQLWNLLKGQAIYTDLLGSAIRVFARRRFGAHPHLPLLLQGAGISRALLLAFDDSVLPAPRSTVASWPSPDGKQVEAFCRAPIPGDSPQTFFHLTHHLHRTIMQDGAATLALLHRNKPAHVCYGDWLALTSLSPVLGKWTTLSTYLNNVQPGEYLSAGTPDEFHGDYLLERTPSSDAEAPAQSGTLRTPSPEPVGGFARQVRERRRLDTAWTLAALLRALGQRSADGVESTDESQNQLEDQFEKGKAGPDEIVAAQDRVAESLARRLVARGQPARAGFLVLNPCSFKRRVAIDLPGVTGPLPLEGPLKAFQLDGAGARGVVEVPALGFAWIPSRGAATSAAPAARMRLADERTVRNEFFEAKIDPTTGGMRAFRDVRTRVSRLGQQLVFNPGSTMRARQVQVTSTGPALGEIVSEGTLMNAQHEVLATFRQRFRAWIGRPVLELRIEIYPERSPQGYPWHAYYGARFAWRDERATLLRGVLGSPYVTTHTRPESPDYLEIRHGRSNTILFPGGLPFHQRQGGRMLDTILVPEGEKTSVFEIGISLDRDYPMQTALGLVTPAPVIPTAQGPPHVGATGWLFHLDAPNLLLSTVRPAAGGADAVVARLLECAGHDGPAEIRCVRDPKRAVLLDARGQALLDLGIHGDAVQLDVTRHDLAHVRIEFS